MADKTSVNTYLENRIQNKYPINHEESIRTGLQMQPMHTCVREDADGKQEGDIRRISTNERTGSRVPGYKSSDISNKTSEVIILRNSQMRVGNH